MNPKILVGLALGMAASVIWGGHAVVARLALAGATGAAVLAFGWVNVRVWAEERRRRRGAV